MPHSNIADSARTSARSMRRRRTDAEAALWRELRKLRHFRRQTPVGPCIADFACPSRRIVVEVDGGGHGHDVQHERDGEHTRWLEAHGLRVVRFWNHDVLADHHMIAGTLLTELEVGT